MTFLKTTVSTLVLAAATTALASAAGAPTVSIIGAGHGMAQAHGSAMMMGKMHGLLATQGVGHKKSHAKGWMAAPGPKVVNVKKF